VSCAAITIRGSVWRVTILSADGQRVIHRCECEDEKEVQGVCTETRHHCLRYRIFIRPPPGRSIHGIEAMTREGLRIRPLGLPALPLSIPCRRDPVSVAVRSAFAAAPIWGQQRASRWWLTGRSEDGTCC
jgi:hypothetical protein